MLNVNQLLRELKKRGFTLDYTGASTVKIKPSDKTKPIYSAHLGSPMLHPLKRFARQNWYLNITTF